jgi:hypothetical protein
LEPWLARARRDSADRAALPVAREYAGMQLRVDTTQMSPEFMSALDEGFRLALAEVVPVAGARAHALLTGAHGSITRGMSGNRAADPRRFATMRMEPTGDWKASSRTLALADPSAAAIRDAFLEWFSRAAFEQLPAPIRRWTSSRSLFRGAATQDDRDAYRTIARANVSSSAACLDGRLRACASLFAIEPGNDTATSWLTHAERQKMVARYPGAYWLRRPTGDGISPREVRNLCVEAGNNEACRDALRYFRVGAPLGSNERTQLLRSAIALGGPDAFDRLRGMRDEEIGTILEKTAGMPLDSLIAKWRSRIVAAKPASPAPTSVELTMSCLLIVGALAVSAGRRP